MNSKAYSTGAVVHYRNPGAPVAARGGAPTPDAPAASSLQGVDRTRLQLRLSVSVDGAGPAQIPAAAFELLRRMPRVDSLREAASGLGRSYRHAWALIHNAERALGTSLIESRRGRGTRLTPYGELLAAALEEIESKLASELDIATQALSAALALGRTSRPPTAAPAASGGRGAQARRRARACAAT